MSTPTCLGGENVDEMVTCCKGNYYIEGEFLIEDTSFFIAHDKKSKEPYMVGEKQATSYMTCYKRLAVTSSYVSALEEFISRLSNAIDQLKKSQMIRT